MIFLFLNAPKGMFHVKHPSEFTIYEVSRETLITFVQAPRYPEDLMHPLKQPLS